MGVSKQQAVENKRAIVVAAEKLFRERGVAAVHLCMVQTNTPARAFYDRLGFTRLDVPNPGPVWYLGRPTTQIPADS